MNNIDCLYDESIDNESYNNNVFNKSLFSEVHSPKLMIQAYLIIIIYL